MILLKINLKNITYEKNLRVQSDVTMTLFVLTRLYSLLYEILKYAFLKFTVTDIIRSPLIVSHVISLLNCFIEVIFICFYDKTY